MTGVLHLLLLILAIISYIEYGYGFIECSRMHFRRSLDIPFVFQIWERHCCCCCFFRGFDFAGCAFLSLIAVQRMSVVLRFLFFFKGTTTLENQMPSAAVVLNCRA